jgi:hypothetical protein
VGELLREELLTLFTEDAEPPEPSSQLAEPEPAVVVPFVAPVLRKYTDMQEFMLVDPIHDVDVDAGWPHVKAG